MANALYGLIYNIIFSQLDKKSEGKLFGKRMENDTEIFLRSFAGEGFPQLWFEAPLAGEAWYDLHVLTSRNSVDENTTLSDGIFYPDLFSWFSKAQNVRQLAMSFDLSKGGYEHPAAQLLVSGRDPAIPCDFLTKAGCAPLADAYRLFYDRLPAGWFACYTGTFPERDDVGLRVECIPDRLLQDRYAADTAYLKSDLEKTGFCAGGEILSFISSMAGQRASIEFQFNVKDGGSASPILGVSLRFSIPGGKHPETVFSEENESVSGLMNMIGEAGLCDDRWRLLPGCAFANRLSAGEASVRFGGYTAFIKVRMRPDSFIDAKTYIMCDML